MELKCGKSGENANKITGIRGVVGWLWRRVSRRWRVWRNRRWAVRLLEVKLQERETAWGRVLAELEEENRRLTADVRNMRGQRDQAFRARDRSLAGHALAKLKKQLALEQSASNEGLAELECWCEGMNLVLRMKLASVSASDLRKVRRRVHAAVRRVRCGGVVWHGHEAANDAEDFAAACMESMRGEDVTTENAESTEREVGESAK